ATAQTADVRITDGTAAICAVMNPELIAGTTAILVYPFPQAGDQTIAALVADVDFAGASANWPVSGTMSLVMRVSTAAVSVTHFFVVALRIKGSALPTATLLD